MISENIRFKMCCGIERRLYSVAKLQEKIMFLLRMRCPAEDEMPC